MIHPVADVLILVLGIIGAWYLSRYVTDHVVGSRKPGRRQAGGQG